MLPAAVRSLVDTAFSPAKQTLHCGSVLCYVCSALSQFGQTLFSSRYLSPLCCSKIAEAEAGVSVNEKKWLVMHVHVQMRLDELSSPLCLPGSWIA
mgnify:CR=1 FL=1